MSAPDLTVKTYDPKAITLAWGPVIVSGYADGTFLKVTRSGNAFEKKKGAEGTVERINKNAYDFTVEVTLLQTASANTVLSGLMDADQLGNVGVFPLIIKDLLGQTLFSAPQAWIAKDPDWEDGDDLNTRTWTFETGPAAQLVGGN